MEANNGLNYGSRCRPDGYTGYWEVYWPNGKLKYRGHFVDGVEVGQQVCYWEDGTVAELSWRDPTGVPRGTAVSFEPDGDKDSEKTWDDDSRHQGTFTWRWYDENGDVYMMSRYVEFTEVESWERPEDYDTSERDAEIDRIVADAVRETIRNVEREQDDDDVDLDDDEDAN